MNTFIDRVIRAARLDVNLYEEVEADRTAMGHAVAVVVLSSLAAAFPAVERVGFSGLFIGVVAALAGWLVWAYLTFLVGTKILPERETRADAGELMRTIGFSSSPGMIRVLGIIPALSGIVSIIAAVWMLIAMVIAVRQALDYKSTLRAVGVCIIGWIIQIIIVALVLSLFVDTAAKPA